jgi:hypothetical protein
MLVSAVWGGPLARADGRMGEVRATGDVADDGQCLDSS